MKAFIPFPLILAVVGLFVVPAAGSQEEWTCNVQVYSGVLGGSPADTSTYFGVRPGMTDGYEIEDSKKPPPPYGSYIRAFFERPMWGQGPIMADWRAPLPEGTTKQWGIDPADPLLLPTDYWTTTTTFNAPGDGCPDPCGYGETYPVAVSIYITWTFGATEFPPPLLPPEDYTFAIKYMGGLSPKPASCAEPGVDVPAVGTAWDMEATPHIAVPIWSIDFQPFTADCSARAAPDVPTFFFIVTNPDAGPVCQIAPTPDAPQAPPARYEFTALPSGHPPFTFVWDFGDGSDDVGIPVSHTYTSDGIYTVTCTITDVNGAVNSCTALIEVAGAANKPPTCCFEYHPRSLDAGTVVSFTDCSTDPDPGHEVTDWLWDFGDGTTSTEQNPLHQYAAGTHEVCLTVTDNANSPASTTCCQAVTVGALPFCCVTGIIETVAGGSGGDGRPATNAVLHWARGVAVGVDGSLYIADSHDHRIRKVDPGGIITTVAGTGAPGYSGDDGPAIAATLFYPGGVAVGADGSIYIADTSNHRIRKVDAAGIIRTVAGTGVQGYSGDGGPATEARLRYPGHVAIGVDGSLYMADKENHRVRKVDLAGIITTVAGRGWPPGYSGDGGAAINAALDYPAGVAAGPDGSLYIADNKNNRIRKVDIAGIITTIAGGGDPPDGLGDGGPAIEARLARPAGVAADDSGVYIGDTENHRVRKVDMAGIITTIAGGGDPPDGLGDGGGATDARLRWPLGVVVSGDGSLFIADGPRIRQIDPAGIITTVAGGGHGRDDGPATEATLRCPHAVAMARDDALYIADSGNSQIRKVDLAGIITTVAGTGEHGYSGDSGPAVQARLSGPEGVAISPDGSLYIADTMNYRVRKVDPSGIITTVAGNGRQWWWRDTGDGGPATEASLQGPRDLALGPDGSLYIADGREPYYYDGGGRIRKVDPVGIITTVAGGGPYSRDGVPATQTELKMPTGVALANDGSLYIADRWDHRIRRVGPDGIITTAAGVGLGGGYGGDGGPAVEAVLWFPSDVEVGADASLYIADTRNQRIRRVGPDGIIITVAGGGNPPDGLGDGGPASEASLATPYGLAVRADDSIYIADTYHHRIRRVGPWGPCFTLSHHPPSAQTGEMVTFESNAHDPRGRGFTCEWDFGDGTGAAGYTATHVYAGPGIYRACLTVGNESGSVGTLCTEVLVTCSGAADAEVLTVLAAPVGRVGKNHSVIVMSRNAGPDACRARVMLRNLDSGALIADRIVPLPTENANGHVPRIEVFKYRWQPADVGLFCLEACVTPVGVCDSELDNNVAAVTVRVRP